MDDSSVVWKYVRPVDSVRAVVVAHQNQDQWLEPQSQGQGLSLWGQGQNQGPQYFVPKNCQGPIGPRLRATSQVHSGASYVSLLKSTVPDIAVLYKTWFNCH